MELVYDGKGVWMSKFLWRTEGEKACPRGSRERPEDDKEVAFYVVTDVHGCA